jgi:methylmalonyl-CoA mutase N-terminal domain/subunit
VIAYESGVAATADPLGGSYAIEHFTNEIEAKASEYIRKIDEIGGMLRAIEIGYVQNEIERSAYEYQRAVENGEQVIVGLNRFQVEEQAKAPVLRIDPDVEREQVERTRAVRSRRNQRAALDSLDRVENAARTDQNLVPHILAAVESYATLGEISDRLRRVFGEYSGSAARVERDP